MCLVIMLTKTNGHWRGFDGKLWNIDNITNDELCSELYDYLIQQFVQTNIFGDYVAKHSISYYSNDDNKKKKQFC